MRAHDCHLPTLCRTGRRQSSRGSAWPRERPSPTCHPTPRIRAAAPPPSRHRGPAMEGCQLSAMVARWMASSASRSRATTVPTSARIGSMASQSLTCMPAWMRPSLSQKAARWPGRVTAHYHVVVPVGVDVSDVLHAEVVLVGEEVRQSAVGVVLAEHVPRGHLGLLDGVVPVLDPDAATQRRLQVVGHVAGRVDVRVCRSEPFVDEDPVVHCEAGVARQCVVGPPPDPDDQQGRRELGSIGEADDGRPVSGRGEVLDAGTKAEVDALGAVDAANVAATGSEDAEQGQLERLDDGDVAPAPAGPPPPC